MSVEIERACDKQVEARLVRLARGGSQVRARDSAVFRADKDRGAAHLVALAEAPLGADPLPWPGRHAFEIDLAAPAGLMRAHPVDTQPYQIRYGVIEVTIAGQFDWNL